VAVANRVLAALGDYVFGQEIGESGTPHLQGCIRFKQKQRFTAVQKLFPGKGVHWEQMKRAWKVNVEYCTKENMDGGHWELIHGNIPEASQYTPGEAAVMEMFYKDPKWYSWQQYVLDVVAKPADPRKIYWFWEPNGNSGKSYLARYLYMNNRCIVGGGKKDNVFHQVAKAMEADPHKWPQLILLDIPRSAQKYVCYGAIEEMKNGFVNSGKYEGAVCVFPPPHVICFANEEPAFEEMSEDRWVVKRIFPARTVGEALMGNQ